MGEDVIAGEAVVAAEAGSEVDVLRARLLRAELRTAAVRAGMVDLDGIKLIDAGALQVTDGGELVDGAGVMKALRVAKPWLFGSNSSSAATAPRAGVLGVKPAMAMTLDEWKVARAEILRRR